jgi:hypothetical protein
MTNNKGIVPTSLKLVFTICLESLDNEINDDIGPVCDVVNGELIIRNALTIEELTVFMMSLGYSLKDIFGPKNYDFAEPVLWRLSPENDGDILVADQIKTRSIVVTE